MTDERRDLAERAARAMGHTPTAHKGPPGYKPAVRWTDANGRPVPDPSLDDAALCWAMLEWLDERRIDDDSIIEGAMFDVLNMPVTEWPEALARAVVATAERTDD